MVVAVSAVDAVDTKIDTTADVVVVFASSKATSCRMSLSSAAGGREGVRILARPRTH
jgi:hypothetical protein